MNILLKPVGAILKLLRDSELRKELGIQARRHVEENFTDGILAKNTIRAYRELAERVVDGRKGVVNYYP